MRKSGFVRSLVMQTGLDPDPVCNLPLIEISGDSRVLIENHKGIISYNCSEVCVRVQYGSLVVCGEGMYLAQIRRDSLAIVGRISAVALHRGGR